jgi:hypothetical protein
MVASGKPHRCEEGGAAELTGRRWCRRRLTSSGDLAATDRRCSGEQREGGGGMTPMVLRRQGRRRCYRNPARAGGANFRQGRRGFRQRASMGELLTENEGHGGVRAEAVGRGEVRLQTGCRRFELFRSELALLRVCGDKGTPSPIANWAQHVVTQRTTGGPHQRLLFLFQKFLKSVFRARKIARQ